MRLLNMTVSPSSSVGRDFPRLGKAKSCPHEHTSASCVAAAVGSQSAEAVTIKLVPHRGRSAQQEHPMNDIAYGFEKRLTLGFDAAVEAVVAALKSEGFGVLTRIDVRDTLQQKIGVEFRRYLILGACNPVLAHRALLAEPQIGLMLPCNAVVQETEDNAVLVSIADPKAMFTMVDKPELHAVATDAEQRLRRVLDALQ
jgi:uncharacterized protein (DUF302 family)